LTTTRTIPKNFDGRVAWKGLLIDVQNQGSCGTCYACASSGALADRYALMSLGQIKFQPSYGEMTICRHNFTDITTQWKNVEALKAQDDDIHKNSSCNGATLFEAADSLYTDGIPDTTCFPLAMSGSYDVPATEDSTKFPYCYTLEGIEFNHCADGKTAMRRYKAKTGYSINADETSIMIDILQNGPVFTGIMIYNDFMSGFDGKGIYTHPDKSSQSVGGHAVAIVGFGEEFYKPENRIVKYWIIRNSWGTDWGDGGFFKMERGLTDIQLEQNCVAVLPDFTGFKIVNPNLQVIETQHEKDVAGYAAHYIDPITGFYMDAIDLVKAGKLLGVINPYINENFPLPDYTKYWCQDVNGYLATVPKKVSPSSYLVVVCTNIGTPATIGVDPNSANTVPVTVNNYDSGYDSGSSSSTVVGGSSGIIIKILLGLLIVGVIGIVGYVVYSLNTSRFDTSRSSPSIYVPISPLDTSRSLSVPEFNPVEYVDKILGGK
jgi:hypothetical protein